MGSFCAKSSMTPEEREKSKQEQKRSKDLERELVKQNLADRQINKLLLLGAGESGKSTLFKQMTSIYGKGWDEKERKSFYPAICNNAINSMRTLIEQSEKLAASGEQTQMSPALEGSKQFILELPSADVLDANTGQHLKSLWADPGIQRAYLLRSRFQLIDSAGYFLDKIDTLVQPNFVPSEQDILRARVRTTGIVEQKFEIDGNLFMIFDVGGQRSERKKWIHCFSEVTAVLFIAALSEYDMRLFEDETVNRMDEAIHLFDEICNSHWFRKTAMILMLNKRDLFAEKIQRVPLTVWEPQYDGPGTYEDAVLFVQDKFVERKKEVHKDVYVHVTCATDKDQMVIVFNAVKDIIIRKSLEEGGLMA